jgi:two-component system, cell cycle response regulator
MEMMHNARVLIIDDEPLNVDMLSQRLSRRGYTVDSALSAAQADERILENIPDVILLDVFMPELSGYDYMEKLRKEAATKTIPVILVSAHSDSDNIVEGLKKGANDYVTKPVNLQVLLARLETQLKMAFMVKQLEAQTAMLARLAAVDELTGVYNRRVLFEHLEDEVTRSKRYGNALSMLMLDLDWFKQVNDRYGHAAGDAVLKEFSQRLCRSVRGVDLVCRYGGEEFCVILPQTSLGKAMRAAEHIRTAIQRKPFEYDGTAIPMTVSIGLTSFVPDEVDSPTDLLERADKALYEAKNGGRNQVRIFEEDKVEAARAEVQTQF